jgi:hypothetical protein
MQVWAIRSTHPENAGEIYAVLASRNAAITVCALVYHKAEVVPAEAEVWPPTAVHLVGVQS